MFFYGWEIKTSLVRETALGQSCIIFHVHEKFARRSGRKARRHSSSPWPQSGTHNSSMRCAQAAGINLFSVSSVCSRLRVSLCVRTLKVCLYVHA